MSCMLCALRSAASIRNVSFHLARPVSRSFVSTSRIFFQEETNRTRPYSGVIRKPRLEEQVSQEEAKRTILIRGLPEFIQEEDIRGFLDDDSGVDEIVFEHFAKDRRVVLLKCSSNAYALKLAKKLGDNIDIAGMTVRVKVLTALARKDSPENATLALALRNLPKDISDDEIIVELKKFDGLLGVRIIRPVEDRRTPIAIVQFDSKNHFRNAYSRLRNQEVTFHGNYTFVHPEHALDRICSPTRKLYMVNWSGSDLELRDLFKNHEAGLLSIKTALSAKGQNLAFLHFKTVQDATRALRDLNGSEQPDGSRVIMRFGFITPDDELQFAMGERAQGQGAEEKMEVVVEDDPTTKVEEAGSTQVTAEKSS